MGRYHYVFPKWTNAILPTALAVGGVAPLYAVLMVAYGFSPETTDVGYAPRQPIDYSHALHAGELGIDCRYCHTTVETADFAAIPPTATCMNCHNQIHKDSDKLVALWDSFRTGEPIRWKKVHDLPDYAFFSHQAHVARGVSCVECHGRVDRMEVVFQHEPLSMGWCLECHRDPDDALRDPAHVFDLGKNWDADPAVRNDEGSVWRELNNLNPSQDCSTCHR